MSEKLFTFLVSFFAAVSNYFHCHCVLFSPIRARPSSIAIWIFTVSWLFTVQTGRLFGRCFLLLLFSHTPHKISSFLLCATFSFISCDFFLTLFGVITMRQSVGTFYVLLLGSSSLPDGFWWGFFSFSQSIPVFYFNLMLSSVGYFGGFYMSIILS